MKHLYLIRHAKSGWGTPGLADFDRTLDTRGEYDVTRMGKRLMALGVFPDLILTSPATRAITTARTIADELGYDPGGILSDDILYNAVPEDTLKIIRATAASCNSLMICGHNPNMTDLINQVSDFKVDSVPTCGAFCATFDVESWTDVKASDGTFVFFEYPKLLE